jgi:hypothetical protein
LGGEGYGNRPADAAEKEDVSDAGGLGSLGFILKLVSSVEGFDSPLDSGGFSFQLAFGA